MSIGLSNPLRAVGGSFSSWFGILLRIWLNTSPEMQTPPGAARGSIREAMFTASPKMSASRCSTSPKWIPIRSWIGVEPGWEFRSCRCCWMSIAHWTARRALPNSERNPSPIDLISRPSWAANRGRTRLACSSRSRRACASFVWADDVEPTMSVNMIAESRRVEATFLGFFPLD